MNPLPIRFPGFSRKLHLSLTTEHEQQVRQAALDWRAAIGKRVAESDIVWLCLDYGLAHLDEVEAWQYKRQQDHN
ncbi:MAG: hypothetical protein PHQ43_11320 [Dehalococcoidales bacterium]|jgi:hypothetical protein|nr:hypothetical protein [Dehalococcoidales bacterium]